MRRVVLTVLLGLAMATMLASCSGASSVVDDVVTGDDVTTSESDAGIRPEGWTEATHGKGAAPDYATVFPQEEVLLIELTIGATDWQAMLDDMVDMYGESGGGGSKQQSQIPPEVIAVCDDLEVGDSCTASLPGKEVTGLCEEVWDGLVACSAEDSGTESDAAVAACEGLEAQAACLFPAGQGTLDGICLQTGMLVCVPQEAVKTCSAAVAGDDCAVGPPGNQKAGTCSDFGGTLACIPEGQGPGGGGLIGLDRNPIWVPCTVQANGLSWQYVGIRFKGNSTLRFTWQEGSYKLPFKLDFDQFEDDHPEIDDQRFYGFKRLTFANNQRDPSYLREKLAGELLSEGGVPTPQRAFVRVHVDIGAGLQYMGLFTMAEVPDKPLFQTHFGDDEGNLYKPEGIGAKWISDYPVDEDSFPKKTNEELADWGDIEATRAALYADRTDAAAWRATLEARFDADGFLRWLAINTVIQDWDQYGNAPHNYYLYGDPAADGRLSWIPWDHNESLKAAGGIMPPLALDMESVGNDWPLIRFLLDDPVYQEAYWTHVADFVAGPFANETISARAQGAHDLIAPYVVGVEGEVEPFTVLSGEAAFDDGLADLLEHIATRHDEVAGEAR